MTANAESSARLIVMQSFPFGPRVSVPNPYTQLLVDSLAQAGVTVVPFSWRRALLGQVDVLHLHWPEHLLCSVSPLRRAIKCMLLAMLAARIQMGRIRVCRTLHNQKPHESVAWPGTWLLSWLDDLTTVVVTMAVEPLGRLRAKPSFSIPLGHYRGWYDQFPKTTAQPGLIATFGLVKPYKGIEDLIGAFVELPDPNVSLVVAGAADNPQYAELLARTARGDQRIHMNLSFLSNQALERLVRQSALLVFPYRHVGNPSAVLTALSLDRPVLLPDSTNSRALQREFGGEWVRLYSGPLDSTHLRAALQWASETSRARADMSRREWANIADRHHEAYRSARGNSSLRAGSR